MSRRKQAKPRALKRGDWDSESLEVQDMIPDDVQSDISGTEQHSLGNGGGADESSLPQEEEEAELAEQTTDTKYRCERCGIRIVSLLSFMDHRNFECMAGVDENASTLLAASIQSDTAQSVAAMETENSLESDLNGTDPPSWRSDTPDDQSLSPSSCATPTDPDVELSCTIGVTETTPYACQFCDKAFPRLSYLKRHEQSHGDQMPFKCEFCQRLFKHKRSRDRHVKLHTGDKKYRCPHCDAAFSRSDHLKIHMKTHDNAKPFQCPTCNRGYNTAAALTSHMQNHKKEPASSHPHRCFTCFAHFKSSQQLQTHLLGHGGEVPQMEKVAQCVYCPQVCVGFDALATHMDSVHPGEKQTKCPVCGDVTPTLELLYQHVKIHEEMVLSSEEEISKDSRKFSCPYCTKDNFRNEEALQLHIQAMHGPLVNGELHSANSTVSSSNLATALSMASYSQQSALGFSCEYCTMKFATVHALQKHTLSVHSFTDVIGKSTEILFCSQCTMGFTSAAALAEHIKLVHSIGSRDSGTGTSETAANSDSGSGGNGQSLVPTNTRNSNASTSTTGMSPKSSPPSEKASKVQQVSSCKSPPSSSSSKAVSTDNKPETKVNGDLVPSFTHPGTLLCNQCNAAFPDFESFRTHLKTHLDEVIQKYICTECQGEFASEEQLDSHVVSHYLSTTTEYGCQCCLKLFSKPDELQKHLMDIHAHHLYRCSLCKEMFDSKVSIQVHFAVKHSNECKLFKCTSCSSIFRSEMEFQLHVKVSHLRQAKPFRCFFCNLSFATDLEFQCHLMSHKKQYTCTLCDEAFHVEFLLDKHMQTKHSAEAPAEHNPPQSAEIVASSKPAKGKPSTTQHATSTTTISTLKKEIKCDICDADLPSDNALNTHRKQVHNIKSSGGQKSSQHTLSLYCAYCSEACKSRTELENHMKVHTLSSSKHKCNVCDEVCPTASILAEHKLTHCKVVSGSLCVICKVNLKSEDQYYSHLQQHNSQGLPLPCVVCRQTLMSEIEVQMHAKFHLKNAEPLYPCCVCLKQLELNNLVANGVNGNGLQSYVCKECFHTNTSNSVTSQTDDLRCSECKVKFESEVDMEKHQLVHKKTYQCIKCQKSFDTENEIQLHVASHMLHEGTNHECKLCHKVFDSPAKLQCHLIEHTFEGCSSYTCYMCSAVFTTASLIQQHMLEHGLNSRPYDCTHCHQKFFFRAELENHVFSHAEMISTAVGVTLNSVELMSDNLQCPDCHRTFTTLMNLTNHRKIHQQKNNGFKCSTCPEVFETSADMQQHYFKMHGNGEPLSPKKSFHCTECDKEFPCLSNLQGHMRIHTHGTKFTCPECSKEFALSRNLNIHMRLHSGEKPYECPMCKKRFARKENRKAHLKSHSGLKPFMCPHCGKTFSRKCHVKEHMRLHTGTPYTCELCPEALASSKQLRQHVLDVHRQELEHVCQWCDERFGLLKNLKKHIRLAHSDVSVRENSSVSDGGGAGAMSELSSPEHSSCSNDLRDAETSECSSMLESEGNTPTPSPYTIEDRNDSTPQELIACE